jgi:hypothetical protein
MAVLRAMNRNGDGETESFLGDLASPGKYPFTTRRGHRLWSR